jgi:hypothetical protein
LQLNEPARVNVPALLELIGKRDWPETGRCYDLYDLGIAQHGNGVTTTLQCRCQSKNGRRVTTAALAYQR